MLIMVFIFGLCMGSFLNVCISRLSRDESIVSPPSHCPECGMKIRWYDNIPIASFFWLKGRCRDCGLKISWQYPLVEFLTGVLFVIVFKEFGLQKEFILYLFFISSIIVIAFIDGNTSIIPDKIVIPGIIAGLIFKIIFSLMEKKPGYFLDSLFGLGIGLSVFIVIILVSRGGMGEGDIKLGGLIGIFLGFKKTILTIMLSFIIGGIAGIILLILKIKGRKDTIPFGPYLAIASIIALFRGNNIWKWWMGR